MRTFAVVLALLAVSLLLTTVSAGTGPRVLEVEGPLRLVPPRGVPITNPDPGREIPAGSVLSTAKGSRARIEFPDLGILTMTGPTMVRMGSSDGTPKLVLEFGEAGFEFGNGELILDVEGGQFELSGVAGYRGSLVKGTSLQITGGSRAARIEVLGGSSIMSRSTDHARVAAGETLQLPLIAPGGSNGEVLLRSREITALVPAEGVKAAAGKLDPLLKDVEKAWTQSRQSPRIP